jgi:hypothetical protein
MTLAPVIYELASLARKTYSYRVRGLVVSRVSQGFVFVNTVRDASCKEGGLQLHKCSWEPK